MLPQVGGVGQRKLKEARIAVVGAGGIGSAVIPALAGAGVGQLTIIDDDVVELAISIASRSFASVTRAIPRRISRCSSFIGSTTSSKPRPIQERIDTENAAATACGS